MSQATADIEAGRAWNAGERSGGLWLASWTLWQREMVRFFRQRSRVVAAVATPLIFWVLLGSGLNRSFVLPRDGGGAGSFVVAPQGSPTEVLSKPEALSNVGYLEYFFPGTVVLVVLFTAIFSTISVIEDRREGFMQAVLVAPIPRLSIVLGKLLGGASIATLQGLLFLAFWPLLGGWPGLGWMLAAVGVMFLLGLGLTGLGLCIAWPMDSTAGFHAVMNLFLMPMWFLSGAVFPVGGPIWLRVVMHLNPLTYGQAAFAAALAGGKAHGPAPATFPVAVGATALFTALVAAIATRLVSRPRKDGTL